MEILKVSEVGLDKAAAYAASVIAKGGVVVYPTDTLYGLGVNALDVKALGRLRDVKARDRKKPVSILVPSVEAIEWHAILMPAAKELATKFLPGALTIVLPARAHLPKEVTQNGAIGVRVPNDAFSRALSLMSEYPVTSTSANLAGVPTPATIQEMILHFGQRVADIDLFIDDGPRAGGTPSTVVLATEPTLRVLREGALTKEMLGF